ncbi:MAG: hypothetical protein ACXAAH_10380 [Promethearchaeota archaeon]
MNLCSPAVIKKDGKWFIGFIKPNGEFKEKMVIKKLSDVKELSNYMTLKRFLKIRGAPSDFQGKVLKKLGAESIYILDKPLNLTKKEWEQWWWAEFHKLCLRCQYECKQSHRVDIYDCKFLQGR